MKNCPNCGAPIDFEHNKCSYCGTPYYDLACMPMDKPFFLRINTNRFTDDTVLARVQVNSFTITLSPDAFPEIELRLTATSMRSDK